MVILCVLCLIGCAGCLAMNFILFLMIAKAFGGMHQMIEKLKRKGRP